MLLIEAGFIVLTLFYSSFVLLYLFTDIQIQLTPLQLVESFVIMMLCVGAAYHSLVFLDHHIIIPKKDSMVFKIENDRLQMVTSIVPFLNDKKYVIYMVCNQNKNTK